MRELFNLLEKKELRILWIMGLLLGLSLLFLVFLARGERNDYYNSQTQLRDIQKSAEKAENESTEKKLEYLQWKDVQTDYKEIKTKYIYRGQDALKNIRLDLQAILIETGVNYSHIKYAYDFNEDTNTTEVTISFDMEGSYMSLKRLIHEVEQFPRFLALERISFSDIDSQTGVLTLKISLSGYYAK